MAADTSWLGQSRRLAVDDERKPEYQAWVQWAMVCLMVKRLARQASRCPHKR